MTAALSFDSSQTDAVDLGRGHPLLLVGPAGSGKTTVALERARRVGSPVTMLVPTEGLVELAHARARRMGVDADVSTFDACSP